MMHQVMVMTGDLSSDICVPIKTCVHFVRVRVGYNYAQVTKAPHKLKKATKDAWGVTHNKGAYVMAGYYLTMTKQQLKNPSATNKCPETNDDVYE